MNGITATELELLACFGAEPHLLDANVPWCYSTASYAVDVDGLSVSFTVLPSYRDVRLIVRRGKQQMLEFSAVGVVDVRVIDERGVDAVDVLLSPQSWLRLRLRPTFGITQRFEGNV
jgi:hypothetical protein